MKLRGIINVELARALAALRHTDTFVIADSGLAVPETVPTIDLAVVYGTPAFELVLRAVLEEVIVEAAAVSTPIAEHNPACYALVRELVPSVETMSHEALKGRVARASFVVRTGEATPFANVVLRAGVPYFKG